MGGLSAESNESVKQKKAAREERVHEKEERVRGINDRDKTASERVMCCNSRLK